jgi:hypothetical protein
MDTLKSRPIDGNSHPQRTYRLPILSNIIYTSLYTNIKKCIPKPRVKKNNLGDQAEMIYQYHLCLVPRKKSLCEKILGLPNFEKWVGYSPRRIVSEEHTPDVHISRNVLIQVPLRVYVHTNPESSAIPIVGRFFIISLSREKQEYYSW